MSKTPLPRDDHVMLPTRIVSWAIVPILSAAFVILYLFPFHTKALWSWEMHPSMTAMVMGGGYLSGAYFFYRAATVKQWHRVGIGFPGITVFATMLGIATIIHWDKFNHGHVSFWAWVLLYWTTPFLLPWLWIVNRQRDPHTVEPGDRVVPTPIRVVMVVVGALQLAFALTMFLRPTAIAAHAPWKLTPLTCRSLSAFAAFPSILYLGFAIEKRWSAFEYLIEVAIAGMGFIGIAAIRAHTEFTGSDGLVWGWRIGLGVAFVLLVSLRLYMGRPVTSTRTAPAAPQAAAA